MQYVLLQSAYWYQDESQDIAAFLTVKVNDDDDDIDEARRERRTAARVALYAVHSAVFEPLTYHTTPATISDPACRAAPTCTTRTANLVKAARRQSALTWAFRMPHCKACIYVRPLTM